MGDGYPAVCPENRKSSLIGRECRNIYYGISRLHRQVLWGASVIERSFAAGSV